MAKWRRYRGSAVGALAVLAMLALAVTARFNQSQKREFVPYAAFTEMAQNGQVARATLTEGALIRFTSADGRACETDNPRNPGLKEQLLLQGIPVDEGGGGTYSGVQTVVGLVCFGAALYLASRMSGRMGAKAAFAVDARAAEGAGLATTFADVAGNEEAKADVADVVDFIQNPDKYASYGARIPRGLIFYGPPGTGKTLMAKAVAGEAGVPFYAVSGSDFVQMYVGVGAARVRELFKKAGEAGKAVIFIDEIDALGKKRAANAAGANDERDQTLNALLSEMSGFAANAGLVVIAATNRLDTLDEALLRPGRFDRHIEIGLPDVSARAKILALHAQNKPLAAGVDMEALAKQAVFFSGAMLENWLNEAAIRAAKDGGGAIDASHIDAAYYAVLAGSPKAERGSLEARKITAYHEAGHALAARRLLPENTVAKVTIIPSTKGAGGFCVNVPPDKPYVTKREIEGQIAVSLAGRAAEELIFGAANVTTGAANDLEKANGLARDYTEKYGMSAEGFVPPTGQALRRACAETLDALYARAKNLLTEQRAALEAVAEALLERESLSAEELDALI